MLQIEQEIHIEDLRGHPPETIEGLRRLLLSGPVFHADRQRKNFFEVEDEERVYYVHISPSSGKVLLLATWPREPRHATEVG